MDPNLGSPKIAQSGILCAVTFFSSLEKHFLDCSFVFFIHSWLKGMSRVTVPNRQMVEFSWKELSRGEEDQARVRRLGLGDPCGPERIFWPKARK